MSEEPLDSMGGSINDPEAGFDRLGHPVPDHLPGDPRWGGGIANDFAIAEVKGEGHSDDLPVTALERKDVLTPARVALKRIHLTVVQTGGLPVCLGRSRLFTARIL